MRALCVKNTMSHDISSILDFDDKFHEHFSEVANRFVPELGKSKYPVTFKTLIGLMGTANSVKLGIYDLAEESDMHLYIIKILHRTLIEHYLKFYYILFRLHNEKSEGVGVEYRKYSGISETMAFINASTASMSIIGLSKEKEIIKTLKKNHPDLNISKKELNDIPFRWKHRNIIKYIKDNTGIVQNEKSYLLKLIVQYSELSSFIHGGTFAEEYYYDAYSENKLDELVYDEVFEACFMAASMKSHLMMAVTMIDNSYAQDMVKISELLREFLAHTHNKLIQREF